MFDVDPAGRQRKGFFDRLGEFITPEGLVTLAVSLVAIAGVAWLLDAVFRHFGTILALPILALSGVLLLLGALLLFTTIIRLIGLSDPKSALGLPEGSVRALLALALVGLFAIMASSVLVGSSPPREIKGVLESDIAIVLKANPAEHDIFWVPETLEAGKPQRFTAMVGSANRVDDFAKQMLTLVGTLMTAIVSFYFGSAAFSGSTSQGESDAQPNPTGISPTVSTEGASQLYTITGTRLANLTRVEALPENGGSPVVADVKAAGAEAKATLKLNKGKWTFHVYTASGAQAAVPVSIDVTEKSPAGPTPPPGPTPPVGPTPPR